MGQEFINWLRRAASRVNNTDAIKEIFDEGLNWADVLWLTVWRVIQVFSIYKAAELIGTGELPAFIIASFTLAVFACGTIFGSLKKDAAAIKQEQTCELQKILEDKRKEHPNDQVIQSELALLEQNPKKITTNSWTKQIISQLPPITDRKTSIVYRIKLIQINNAVRLSTEIKEDSYAPVNQSINFESDRDEESGLLTTSSFKKPEPSRLQSITKIVYQVSDSYPGKVFTNLWNSTPMVLWASPVLGWGISTLYAGPDAANYTDSFHLVLSAIYGPVVFVGTYTTAKIVSYYLQPKKTEAELKKEKEDKKQLQRTKLAEVLFRQAVTHELNLQVLKNHLPPTGQVFDKTEVKSLPVAKLVKTPITPNEKYLQSTWLETLIPIAIKLSSSSIVANFGAWEGSNVAGLIELLLKNSSLANDLINNDLQLKVMASVTNLVGPFSTVFFASNQHYQQEKLTAKAKQILDTVISDNQQKTLFDSIQALQEALAANRQTIKNFKADIRRMATAANEKPEKYIPTIKIMKDFTDLKNEFTLSFIEKIDKGITLFGRIGGGIYWYRFYILYLFNNKANYGHFAGASIVGTLLSTASAINFSCGDNFEFKKQLVNGLFEVADFVLKKHVQLSESYIEVLQYKHAELKQKRDQNTAPLLSCATHAGTAAQPADENTLLLRKT